MTDEIGIHPSIHLPVEYDHEDQRFGWWKGDAGTSRLRRLAEFLGRPDNEASRKFGHRLCTMPNGIGSFNIAGVEATMAKVGAARLLEMLADQLPFDELIEMLLYSSAPGELIQSMDAPRIVMLRVYARRDDVPLLAQILDDGDEVLRAEIPNLLLLAVLSASAGVVRFLLCERGAEAHESLLAAALEQDGPISTDIVRLLVDAGAARGVTLTQDQLYRAVWSGAELCRLLITAETDAAVVQEYMDVAISLTDSRCDVIELCLDLGASLSPQQIARAAGESTDCFRLFQSRKLLDASLISQAVKFSFYSDDCFALLFKSGATLDDPELLPFAIRFAPTRVVRQLVEAGADFRTVSLHRIWKTNVPDVPRAYLCVSRSAEQLTTLIEVGADANALDGDGHSALFTLLGSVYVSSLSDPLAAILLAVAPDVADADAVIGRACTHAHWYGYGAAEAAPKHEGSLCAMLLATGWAGPDLVAAADAVELQRVEIDAIRRRLIRPRIATICIALQPLALPALVTLTVIDAAIPAAPWLSMLWKWNVVTAVKHAQREQPTVADSTCNDFGAREGNDRCHRR